MFEKIDNLLGESKTYEKRNGFIFIKRIFIKH